MFNNPPLLAHLIPTFAFQFQSYKTDLHTTESGGRAVTFGDLKRVSNNSLNASNSLISDGSFLNGGICDLKTRTCHPANLSERLSFKSHQSKGNDRLFNRRNVRIDSNYGGWGGGFGRFI